MRLPSRFSTALAVPLLLVFLLGAVACKKRETRVEAGLRTQTLHIGNQTEVQDLDPQICTAYTDYNILIALFEGLTCIDEASSEAVPGVAERWDISPDGLTYTFHLRADAKWSNGDPVTAQDFLFSYQRILSPKLASEYSYMLWCVKGAQAFNEGKTTDFATVGFQAIDARTFRIELAQPTPYLLALIAHQSWFPVHPPTILKHGTIDQRSTGWTSVGKIVGNGAYQLREWSQKSRIIVERQPHYWDPKAADGVREVCFYPVENVSTEESMFRTGQLHLTYDVLPERIPHYRATQPAVIRVDPFLETFYLMFNVTRKPFDDIRVRRALSLALNREAIAEQLLFGSRLPAYHFTPPNTGGYQATARVQSNADAARAELAAAGFPGGKGFPTFELLYNTDPINTKILEAVQQMWRKELGITCNLANAEFQIYLDTRKRLDYAVARARWVADYNEPMTYLDLFVTDGGNNQTGFSDPLYDRTVAQAQRAGDQTERFALYQKVEARLLEEMPVTPVFFGTRSFLIHPTVQGWVPSLLGIHRYQYVRLAEPTAP